MSPGEALALCGLTIVVVAGLAISAARLYWQGRR